MSRRTANAAKSIGPDLEALVAALTQEQRAILCGELSTCDRIDGWKSIADVCEYSVSNARRDATRNIDPLPVWYSHRGVWAYRGALHAWMTRQDVSYAKMQDDNASRKAAFVSKTSPARVAASGRHSAAVTAVKRTKTRAE